MFWIQIRPHFCSFSFKGIPDELHFTLALNSNSGVNFHITKNIEDQEDKKKKPFISILEINKEVILSNLDSLFLNILFGILNEIEIKENSEISFLSFKDLKKDKSFGENDVDFFKTFESVSKLSRKSTRLKVNEGWTDKFVEITQSEKMKDIINENTKKIDKSQLGEIDGGILSIDEKTMTVIKIYDKWYELSINNKPIDMFKRVIDEQLARLIWFKIKRSIIILKSVKSWKETENRHEPIEIFLNK